MLSEEEKKDIEQAVSNILRGIDIESSALILEKAIMDNYIIAKGRVNILKIATRQILNFIEEYRNKGYLDVVREKVKAKEEITKLQKENETTCKLNANMSKRHLNDTSKIKNYEKQIDLMINFMYETWCKYPGSISHELRLNGFNDNECGTCENTNKNCIKCLKDYFEKLAKEKGK